MQESPTVSVIIPTYNRAHLLNRTIQSVLNQTYTDFELIVVDDGSTDNTEGIVQSFNDPRIRFIRHEQNRGAPSARNTGIRAATGEFISFVDSDDEWLATKLEEQVKVIQAQPGRKKNLSIVVTGQVVFDDSLRKVVRTQVPKHSGYLHELFFSSGIGANSSMLVPKKCFDEIGMYDENLSASQHWDMSVRLAAKYEYKVIPKPLVVVHQHEGPHVRTTVNRQKATKYLLLKYAAEIKRYPKAGAAMHLQLGRLQLQSGLRAKARREFITSIRLNPYVRGAYAYLLSSFLGIRALPRLRRKK